MASRILIDTNVLLDYLLTRESKDCHCLHRGKGAYGTSK